MCRPVQTVLPWLQGQWLEQLQKHYIDFKKQRKGECRIPSVRQAALGSGEVLMSSLASCSSTCILPANDPGQSWKRAPASAGDEVINAEKFVGSSQLLSRSLFLFPFISMRQSKEPGVRWAFLPLSCSDLFACINEPIFQKRE